MKRRNKHGLAHPKTTPNMRIFTGARLRRRHVAAPSGNSYHTAQAATLATNPLTKSACRSASIASRCNTSACKSGESLPCVQLGSTRRWREKEPACSDSVSVLHTTSQKLSSSRAVSIEEQFLGRPSTNCKASTCCAPVATFATVSSRTVGDRVGGSGAVRGQRRRPPQSPAEMIDGRLMECKVGAAGKAEREIM